MRRCGGRVPSSGPLGGPADHGSSPPPVRAADGGFAEAGSPHRPTEDPVLARALALVGERTRLDFADAYLAATALEDGPAAVASFDGDLDEIEGVAASRADGRAATAVRPTAGAQRRTGRVSASVEPPSSTASNASSMNGDGAAGS